MARQAGRVVVFRSVATPRWYSTLTATTPTSSKVKEDSLYRRLWAVGGTDANLADVLNEWVKQGKSVQRFDIISCVNQLRKFRKYQHAIQLYDWMEKSKNEMNNADRAIFIDLLAKTEGIAPAEKYFNSLQESAKTQKTYGALLNCYCRGKMLDKAIELSKMIRELNFTSTLNYNNMMSLYLSVGQPEKVHLLSKEMEENSIAADLYTYNQLMNSYASLNNLDAVERLVEKMEANKVKHDWFTYGNLATIYVNAGLIEKANAVLQKLEKMKGLHDPEAFHTLITLYMRTSNLAGINRVWDSLKSTFPKPLNTSYLVKLLALFKLEDIDGLESSFREWESGYSTYDVRLPNVVLESYLNRNMIKEANLIYENIVERGAEPNLTTLDLFMKFYLREHKMDLALNYLEMGASKTNQGKSKWFPTDESVCKFLKHFEEEKDVEGAEKFYGIMKRFGLLNSELCDSLLQTHIAAGKVERHILLRAEEDGIKISPETE